ncbi:MAG: hypothetical protein RBR16_00550 [Syntrophus sp. (in: bacteria)]|jgi:hypothetical protein|nr:hypothetical protein [Syntrophus sp. (in: bacteria)]
MTVGESIQFAGLVYLILIAIGFGTAGLIKAMSIFFGKGKQ